MKISGGQLLCRQDRAEWSWPRSGSGWRSESPFGPTQDLDIHRCGLTVPPRACQHPSDQSLSSTPSGRHRLTGQRAWPMDPAKTGKQRATRQARLREISWMEYPGPCPSPHTSLLPQCFSHAKDTCQECAGAPRSQRARETPQSRIMARRS